MMMTTTSNKMICPNCRVAMNHHGDKLVHVGEEIARVDEQFGGLLEEFHTCPNCGRAGSRPAIS
jgi:ribosomal protein S27AE